MPTIQVVALLRSAHPGPVLVLTTLVLALGLAVGLTPGRLALVVAAVLAGQLSIGLSNDAIDADRDRASGRTDKPIAQGQASKRVAWIVAVTLLVLALLISVPLGAGFVAANATTIFAAWAYNLGLKQTAFSLVPFLSFGLFPSLATLAAPGGGLAPFWAGTAAAALGMAGHFTNALPDLDADERTAVRGLPHRLGARTSAILAALFVLGGALAGLLGTSGAHLTEVPALGWVFFGLVAGCAVAALVLALVRPATRAPFQLVMLGSLLLAVQLVATAGSLTG
ncbi:MAG: UbiA family prenyltransferase [Brooklawnia sp.]|jgi:4-hydroxybenzoate polyprenyltransferase